MDNSFVEPLLEESRKWEKGFVTSLKESGFSCHWGKQRVGVEVGDMIIKVPIARFVAFFLELQEGLALNKMEGISPELSQKYAVDYFKKRVWDALESNVREREAATTYPARFLMPSVDVEVPPLLLNLVQDILDFSSRVVDELKTGDEFSESIATFKANLCTALNSQRRGDDLSPEILGSVRRAMHTFILEQKDPIFNSVGHDFMGKANWKRDPKDGRIKLVDFGFKSWEPVPEKYGDAISKIIDAIDKET